MEARKYTAGLQDTLSKAGATINSGTDPRGGFHVQRNQGGAYTTSGSVFVDKRGNVDIKLSTSIVGKGKDAEIGSVSYWGRPERAPDYSVVADQLQLNKLGESQGARDARVAAETRLATQSRDYFGFSSW